MGKFFLVVLPFLLAISSLGRTSADGSTPLTTTVPTAPASRDFQETFGRLPVVFEPNRGQAPDEVLFLARSEQYVLFLTKQGLVFSIPDLAESCSDKLAKPASSARHPCAAGQVRMLLVGANEGVGISGLDDLGGRSHYYLGRNRTQWITDVPHLGKVRYAGVYAGIDLVLHGTQRQLEFDLVLAPGASVSAIQLEFRGARGISLSPEGDLLLGIEGGTLSLAPPYVYQDDSTGERAIAGKYRLLAGGRVAFEIGPYDPDRTLVIDPVLTYAGRLGGSNRTTPTGIGVDSSGNVVVTGQTFALDFPTVSPVQGTFGGSTDVFVSKLNSSGSALIYSTFLGGTAFDGGEAIAVDAAGNAYVVGGASSTTFPTTPGAFQETCIGENFCSTAFAAKFQPNGTLAYSTFLGGASGSAVAIAVDSSGNAYIAGGASFNDMPVVNAFQPEFAGPPGGADAFLWKLNSTGSGLVYSTYLGGPAFDRATAIAVDTAGSAYVAGEPGTGFPLKSPIQVDLGKIFVTKFTPDGSALEYSTIIGGFGLDQAGDIEVDGSGNAYLAGSTSSADFPFFLNSFKTSCPPIGSDMCTSAFAIKINPTGTALLYSTLLGEGFGYGLAVDASGNAYVTGTSGGSPFPTLNAIQSSPQIGAFVPDAFVVKLDGTGSPTFSTYLGGADTEDDGLAIAVDASGNAYVTGETSRGNGPPDFPLVNPLQPGTLCCDAAFVAKISPTSAAGVSLEPREGQIRTLRNVGSATLNISNISLSAGLTRAGDCGNSLTGGGSCTMTFQGNGTVSITSNASGSPHSFSVSSVGLLGPRLQVSPPNLGFGARTVGITTSPKIVTLTNIGFDPVTLNNFLVGGQFQMTHNCPGVLASGAACEASVTFSPSAPEFQHGFLSIFHDPNATETVLFLGGTGVANSLLPSFNFYSFGTQFVGDQPLARVATLSNISTQSVNLGAITTSGEFSHTNACPASLAVGASCRIALAFQPLGNGNRTGKLTVAHSGQAGGVEINLQGTGKIRSDLAVDPLELDFIWNILNFPSNPQMLALTNQGASPLSITSFDLPPDFSQTNDCPVSLAPAASCTVTVIFTPTQIGDRSGNLLIHHDGTGTPQVILLKGEGRTQLSITPESIDFGTLPVGATSEWRFISVGNGTINQPATINSITISGDFALAQNPCPSELPPFFGCALQVTFTPTAAGLRAGSVMIDASDLPTPHIVPLSGMGVDSPFPAFSPASFEFAAQAVGTTSAARLFTMTNVGNQALNITSITTTGPFSRTHSCPSALQPAQSCQISVTFTPTTPLLNVGSLLVQSNAFGSPHSAMLTGTGLGGLLFVNPESVDFGNLVVGTTSNQAVVGFSNTGNAPFDISSITISGDFAQTNSCATTIQPTFNCAVQVTFTPTGMGTRNGTLTLTANAAGSPKAVSLQGNGLDFQVTLPAGTPSSKTIVAGQTATFDLSFVGTAGFFSDVNLTCAGAPPLGNCTITPTSVSLQGATTASAVVNVTTRAPTGSAGSVVNPPAGNPPAFASLAALLALCGFLAWMAGRLQHRPLRNSWGLRATLLLALLFAACGGGGGGGGSSNPPPPSPGTPPGSYIITVTATPTFGNTHTITLTVVVQ